MSEFKIGEIVVHKLTGEHLLLLEPLNNNSLDFLDGFYARTMNYDIVQVAELELLKRNINV